MKFGVLLSFVSSLLATNLFAISESKLSVHLINHYTPGSSNIVAGQPRLLKLLAADSYWPAGMVEAMRDYKSKVPDGLVVVRVYSPQQYSLSSNAAASAAHFWTNILDRSLKSISAADRALIDYLEGPNEGQTPTLGFPWDRRDEAARWLNQFWTNLTPRIVSAGLKPCIGSIAVGNPGGTPSQWQPLLATFVPALRQAHAAAGAWSYHSYTLQYTTDLAVEIHDSLRYRQFYEYFAEAFPDLVALPLMLTEGGVDEVGDRLASGWQARGPSSHFQRWLNWFDGEMAKDDYVLGCTLFQNGDPYWASFDLEQIMSGAAEGVVPIANWLGEYLSNPATLPAVPSGIAANASARSVSLSWTNIPQHPTTFSVKRGRASGGPFILIASNITQGVTASRYEDHSVTNGGTYFYVVSARNDFGESADSSVVSATLSPLPDVTITALSSLPTTIYEGNSVTFRATVKNLGAAATPTGPGKGIGIGFTLNGGAFFAYRGADESLSLSSGASATYSANGPEGGVTWPATLGTYTLSAHVDDVDRFSEVDEANNIFVTNIHVGVRLNAGGAATTGSFIADKYFAGGNAFTAAGTVDTTLLNTVAAPTAAYFSERSGDFSYRFQNLSQAHSYALRIHFAELSQTNVTAGSRVFDVRINGDRALADFDIFAATGARLKAISRRFYAQADAQGQIVLQFISKTGLAQVCALDLTLTNSMPNAVPIFFQITNRVAIAGTRLEIPIAAIDPDQPQQQIAFTKVSGPATAQIDAAENLLVWNPEAKDIGTNVVILRVADGAGGSAHRAFEILVYSPPQFEEATFTEDRKTLLRFSSAPGLSYQLETRESLETGDWTALKIIQAVGTTVEFIDDRPLAIRRFYRVRVLE